MEPYVLGMYISGNKGDKSGFENKALYASCFAGGAAYTARAGSAPRGGHSRVPPLYLLSECEIDFNAVGVAPGGGELGSTHRDSRGADSGAEVALAGDGGGVGVVGVSSVGKAGVGEEAWE